MAKYARVFIKDAALAYDRDYDYRIPEADRERIALGHRVRVPFGRSNKDKEAFVCALFDEEAELGEKSEKPVIYKEIRELCDPEPWLTKTTLRLVQDMKLRYAQARGKIASLMLPPLGALREERERKIRLADFELAQACVEKNDFRSIQQLRALETLIALGGETSTSYLKTSCDCGDSTLKTLVKKGLCVIEEQRTAIQEIRRDLDLGARIEDAFLEELRKKDAAIVLNEEQQQALRILNEAYLDRQKAGQKVEYLLKGVTGSGKTEVYLSLCESVLAAGQQVIVLVPEIALTPQMIARFEARFPDQVASLHSRLRLYERLEVYQKIRHNEVSIVIGPRSAVFAPFERLGLILIDECHEQSFVQKELAPHYSALSVARLRARYDRCLLLLGSATPSVEDRYRCDIGRATLIELKGRPKGLLLPQVKTIDLKKQKEVRLGQQVMSRHLIQEIEETLKQDRQAMIFLNRRGFSPIFICPDCGERITCPHCSVTLNYHRREHKMICHYCGHMQEPPSFCPSCGSGELEPLGFGTERVAKDLSEHFPEETILRMDTDTVRTLDAYEEILGRFRREEARILVGTQMIAKGHDFPKLRLVGILGVDQILSSPDLRADERAFQLMTQAAGRAGRADEQGLVLIEAFDLEHEALNFAIRQDYEGFYQHEIQQRKLLLRPPFRSIATVLLSGKDASVVQENCAALYARAKTYVKYYHERQMQKGSGPFDRHSHSVSTRYFPPAKASMARLKDRHRFQFSVIDVNEAMLAGLLSDLKKQRLRGEVVVSTHLDPA